MIPIKPAYFTSEYSSYLYSFVESKRRCGYKYNGEVKELQRLDRFLSSNSQTPDNHSENVIYTWLSKKSNESVKTFSTRNSIYRQLYGYLALENDEPPLPIPPSARERIHGNGFTPYIFSHDEINRMFSAIDNEKNCSKSFLKYAPLLFRLLYATGLRINEALSLRMEDLTAENVVKFLDHLEKEGLSVSTRNQRLAVIRSFCKYIRFKSPRHLHSIDQILAIPRKKEMCLLFNIYLSDSWKGS